MTASEAIRVSKHEKQSVNLYSQYILKTINSHELYATVESRAERTYRIGTCAQCSMLCNISGVHLIVVFLA